MIRVFASSPDIQREPTTYLVNAYNSGTSLDVVLNDGFTANDYVVVGDHGQEKAEIGQLSGVPGGTSLTLNTSLKNSYPKDAVVKRIPYNQVEFSFSSDDGDNWTVLDTVSIAVDEGETLYQHGAGLSTYLYRFRYKNATTSLFSEYSDNILGGGFSRNALASMVQAVRDDVGEESEKFFSDSAIIDWLNRAQDEIKRYYPKWWFLHQNTSATSVVGQDYIALPTDYDHSLSVLYRKVDTNPALDTTKNLREVSKLEMDRLKENNLAANTDDVSFFYIDRLLGRVIFDASSKTTSNTFTLDYFAKMTRLATSGDETIIPDPDVLIEYAVAKARQVISRNRLDIGEFLRKRLDLLRAQKTVLGQPTGLRNPVSGLGSAFKGIR